MTDSDSDGLTDVTEAYLGTDPARADSDGDGTNDYTDRDPLAGAAPATLVQKLVTDAYSHYDCVYPEPVIFEAPENVPVVIPNRRCWNVVLSGERIDEIVSGSASASLHRALEILRYELERSPDGTRAAVKVIDSRGWRLFFYKLTGTGDWIPYKRTETRLHDEKPLTEW